MWLVVFKNDTFRPSVYGPFDDRESANKWGNQDALLVGERFYVVPLNIAIPHDAPVCLNHNPVQHRDGKTPWCRSCGLTAGYQKPKSSFDKEKRNG